MCVIHKEYIYKYQILESVSSIIMNIYEQNEYQAVSTYSSTKVLSMNSLYIWY